jgi:F-type H+-transporting ATPase subunit b
MRTLRTTVRLLAVAALFVVARPAPAADPKVEGSIKVKSAAAPVYVKEGSTYRELTAHEIEEAAEAHTDKAEKAGLKRYDLGIYTLIVFGILIFVLSKYAWPHIAEGLRNREASIIGAREEAQKTLQEAQDLRTKLQRDQGEAQDKIRALLDDARKQAEADKARGREDAAREAAAAKERAAKDIEAAKDAAMQDIYQQAVELASMLSAKTIRRQISAEDHRRLLDEALAEMKAGAARH